MVTQADRHHPLATFPVTHYHLVVHCEFTMNTTITATKISFRITNPLEVKRFSDTHETVVLLCFVPEPGNSTPCKTNTARLSRGKDLIGIRSFILEWITAKSLRYACIHCTCHTCAITRLRNTYPMRIHDTAVAKSTIHYYITSLART